MLFCRLVRSDRGDEAQKENEHDIYIQVRSIQKFPVLDWTIEMGVCRQSAVPKPQCRRRLI
jgi:hypothetical protein